MNTHVTTVVAAATILFGCSTPSRREIREVLERAYFADEAAYCSVLVVEHASPTGGVDLSVATGDDAERKACVQALVGLDAATALTRHTRHASELGLHEGWSFRAGPNAVLSDLGGSLKRLAVRCGSKALVDAAPLDATADRVDVAFTRTVAVDRQIAARLPCGTRPSNGDEVRRATLRRSPNGGWTPGRERDLSEQ